MIATTLRIGTSIFSAAVFLICTPISELDAVEVKIPSRGKALAVYAPPPHAPPEAIQKHLRGSGVFAFHLRSDGTVSRVQVVESTGHAILDEACVRAFSRWRFARGAKIIR